MRSNAVPLVMGRAVIAFGVLLPYCDGDFDLLAYSGIGINCIVCHSRRRDATAPSDRSLVGRGGLCAPFVTDFLIWGSFPFNIDNDGVSRLRMIPFVPWPSGQFGQY